MSEPAKPQTPPRPDKASFVAEAAKRLREKQMQEPASVKQEAAIVKAMEAQNPEPPKAPEKPAEPPKTPEVPKPSETPKIVAPVIPPTDAKAPDLKAPEVPKELSPKELNFRQLEAARNAAEAKAAELEKALAEARAKAEAASKPPPDYEEIKKQKETYEQLLSRVALEQRPEFKARFDDRITRARESAVQYVPTEQQAELKTLLEAPASKGRDARIKAIVEALDTFEGGMITQHYAELNAIEKDRATALANAKEDYQRIKAAEAQALQAQRDAEMQRVKASTDAVLAQAAANFAEFAEREGDVEHNQAVAVRRSKVVNYTNEASPPERAKIAAWAVYGENAAQTIAMQQALITKLQESIKGYESANPDPTQGRDAGKATPAGGDATTLAGMAARLKQSLAQR